MNTQLNIKARASLFGPSFVTLLIGIVAVLALGSPSVQAQSATVDSSITIAVKGTISDPSGPINVNGNVIVSCRRVLDTTSTVTPALVLLDFDFSGVKGTSGTGTKLKTYVTGDNHANEIRPFFSSDTIIVTAPYFDAATMNELSARTTLMTANLNYDINTGKVTSGTISVGNNVVTTQAVGSTTESPQQIQPQ